jgi:hypothetical protein
VKIAVAVSGIERFNGHSYQEIALSGVANALASRCMADAVRLMQGVGHVISESGLRKNPLAIRFGKRGKRTEQKGYYYFPFHEVSSPLNGYGQNGGSIRRSRYNGHRSVSLRDSMNLFSFAFLIESNRSQNGCHDHAWAVDPGQNLV